MIDITKLSIGDTIEDHAHNRYFVVDLYVNGDVKVRDNMQKVWLIRRYDLRRNYEKTN